MQTEHSLRLLISSKSIKEKLSACEHDSWSRWMKHLFSVSSKHPDGSVTISSDLVSRWERQLNTPYEQLSESEKESDRKEVDMFLNVLMEGLSHNTGNQEGQNHD